MNMKTAIIIGVIILLVPVVIMPFFMPKNNDNEQNVLNEVIGEDILVDKVNESGEESGNKELIVDNNIEEKETDSNISGEILNVDISGEIIDEINHDATNDEALNNENNTEINSSNKNESIVEKEMPNNKPTEIKQEPIKVEVEQNVEIQDTVQEQTEKTLKGVEIPINAVGILKIDKIGLYQPVMEGHSLEVLKTNLGHVDETAYFNGNIGILGHNNGNAGFFKRLTELKIDDVIEYITEDGTKTYKVTEIIEIEDTDWSKLSKTEDNRITLITCVRNVPSKRYCVQAVEI